MERDPHTIQGTDPSLRQLNFEIPPQPTDTSCGPTCLQAIYSYYDQPVPLDGLIGEIPKLDDGGTLAVMLGIHALRRGWRAKLYSYNLRVFDPTWFHIPRKALIHKLEERLEHQKPGKRKTATRAYVRFAQLGGEIRFGDLTRGLIRRYLNKGVPILTGLSSTFLYRTMRELPDSNADDDIRGEPAGHFVVLCGYNRATREVIVADPYGRNPFSPNRRYAVKMNRLINAILLGVLTYDANLLILRPPK